MYKKPERHIQKKKRYVQKLDELGSKKKDIQNVTNITNKKILVINMC